MSILRFFFGSSRLDPWGFARRVPRVSLREFIRWLLRRTPAVVPLNSNVEIDLIDFNKYFVFP
jgi:hypothetical protein